MGKVRKQTRKLKQKAGGGDLRRMPKSVTARANKRRRLQRAQVNAAAEAMDDNDVAVVNDPNLPARSIEEMDIDALLGSGPEQGRDEIAAHAAEMKALADTDPDFYKHLVANNPDLLNFEDDDVADAENNDGDDDDDPDGADSDDDDDAAHQTAIDLTKVVPALLRSVREQKSHRSLKRLVRLFRMAAHADDDRAQEQDAAAQRSAAETAVVELRLNDPSTFDRLLRTLFKHVPGLMGAELGPDPKRSPSWKVLEPAVRSFLGNAIHFVGKCVEPRLLQRALRALGQQQDGGGTAALLAPFPKLCQRYLKVLLQIWGKGADQVRIEAFLQLRALIQALRHRPAFVGAALRGLYGTFVRNAKFLTAVNAPMLRFMQNCIVEIYALDDALAYQHAFIYLRQIAVRLRASAAQVDAQLLNSVRVWARVLARLAPDAGSALRPLCYPFVQVVLALTLAHSSTKYFPLQLQCAEMLHEVSSVTGDYVALAPILLSVICSTNWAPVGSTEKAAAAARATAKAPPIETMIAAPNSLLRAKAFQDAVMQRAVTLLRLHLMRYSRSIAFPELGAPIRRALTKFAAATKIMRFRKLAQKLAVQISSNMTFIESRRGECEFSPKDREAIAAWSAALPKTPLEAYSESAGDRDSASERFESVPATCNQASDSESDQEESAAPSSSSDQDSGSDSDVDPNAEDVVADFTISSSDESDDNDDDDNDESL